MSDEQFPGIEGLPDDAADRVEKVCLLFEDAWQARPPIGEFLGEAAGLERAVLFSELLRLDKHFRRQAGERPSAEEYRAQFPEFGDRIEAAFAKAVRPGPIPAEEKTNLTNGPPIVPPPVRSTSDCNLLFGMLALQMEFISRDALIAALHAWVLAKHKPLGQILREEGALNEDERALLEALVQKHLRKHGNDPRQSLSALPTPKVVREELSAIIDKDVQASVDKMALTPDADSNATVCEPPSSNSGAAGLRYRVLRAHDEGGLGKVSVAHDEELHREVAFKEIREGFADDPHLRRRFVQEGKITGALEHPGIVPVYGLGRHADGRPYYAMRFIRGESLKKTLERFHQADVPGRDPGERNLALRQLLGQFVVVCKTIAFAHDRGVIHRDLKPANIMLGKYGETLVVDWGLAKAVGRPESARDGSEATVRPSPDAGVEPTVKGRELGSPPYMSPEQAAGRVDQVGPASDIFGLGATLYAVLTGQAPYQGKDRDEIVDKARAGVFLAPRRVKPEVGRGLEAICLKAMAFEPGGRYTRALDLAADVETWLADEPVRVWKEPIGMRLRRWARRHKPAVAAAAAAVMVGLLLAGAGVLWAQRQAEDKRREVETALERSAGMQRKARWAEARAILEQAEARLGVQGPEDLRRRLEGARRDLDLVALLDAIRLKRATLVEGRFDFAGEDRAYAAVFREAGLGAVGQDPGEVAARVRASAVREELVAALDDWAYRLERGGRLRWVLAVARGADPDHWRDRVRHPRAWNNQRRLARLGRGAQARKGPARFGGVVGMRLQWLGGDGEALLRAAQERRPGDFWINNELGNALSKKQAGEAVGYYRAALAVRPGTSPVLSNLGNALYGQGKVSEAVKECRRAIALDPKFAMAHNNLGNALKALGNVPEAVKEYRRAIALDPKLAPAHTNLGAALYHQGKLSEAVKECRRAIDLDPKLAMAHNNLGSALYDQGRRPEAVKEYRRAIALDPKVALAHTGLGNALKDQGKLSEAVKEYRQAIALDPKLALAHTGLGNALKAQGKVAEAVKAHRRAIALDPRDAQAHTNLGAALHDQGKLAEAVREHRRAIALDPKFAPAHSNLGYALKDQGKFSEAVKECRRAIALGPKFAPPHCNLGVALEALGKVPKAAKEYRRAIALDPKLAQAHFNLGHALYAQRKWAAAVRSYRRAIALDPRDAPAHYNLGLALAMQGKLAEAETEYRRAIALNPKDAKAHSSLGNALRDQGKVAEAVRELRRAIALDPKYARAHYNLGIALGMQGKLAEAETECRRAIALDPKDAKAHYNLGTALAMQGELAEAETEYRQAIALDPKDAKAHSNLGLALRDQGKVAEAVRELRRAIALDPKYAPAHYNLGLALYNQGKWAGAAKEYRRAIALNPKDAQAHTNLGIALYAQRKVAEAVKEYRQAIDIDPKNALAHGALGQALLRLGKFAEARRATRGCLRRLPNDHPQRPFAAWQLGQCQQLLTLDRKLTAVLQGDSKPANPAEQLKLADLCARFKKRYGAAVRFYTDAFAAQPKLADNPGPDHRYHAACCAALAAAGQGIDADNLAEKEKARLRGQALTWLKADLAMRGKQFTSEKAPDRQAAQKMLLHWQKDPDLAGVRDPKALARVPETERKEWAKLWGEVAALLKEAGPKP
jgi:tetratricopeptide (TPR) repeat protein/tRNA A-37 threonylcarbamoyl transferase component Bud32